MTSLINGMPDDLALILPDSSSLTYRDLRRRLSPLQRVLTDRRYGPQPLVMIFMDRALGSVLTYLAAFTSGAVVALMQPPSVDTYETLIASYEPEFIAIGGHPTAKRPADYRFVLSLHEMSLFARATPGAMQLNPVTGILLSTSGSTGTSKVARISRDGLTTNTAAIVDCLEISHDDTAITSLPLHHGYGLTILNTLLHVGGTVILADDSPLTRRFWQLSSEHSCTHFAAVPSTYSVLLRSDLLKTQDSLRTLTMSGSKLSTSEILELHRTADALGALFFSMYGQTEAGVRMAILPPQDCSTKPSSVGLPVAGSRFEILQDAHDASSSSVGEIIFYGPSVMLGYARDRTALGDGDQLGGRLPTGDLGYLDRDGYLFITGRLSRIAKLYGQRIELDELESVLSSIGPSAVVMIDDRTIGVLSTAPEAIVRATLERALEQVVLSKRSIRIRTVDQLPATTTGKVDYTIVRAHFENDFGPASCSAPCDR